MANLPLDTSHVKDRPVTVRYPFVGEVVAPERINLLDQHASDVQGTLQAGLRNMTSTTTNTPSPQPRVAKQSPADLDELDSRAFTGHCVLTDVCRGGTIGPVLSRLRMGLPAYELIWRVYGQGRGD